MVHPFWSFGNDTATAATDSTAEIDIARQLNAEKDREIERLSRQLEAQKKAQVHSNTQRRTSPILWRLYLASLQNLTLRIKQSPVRKHRLPSSCRKNLWYRYPQRNRRGLVEDDSGSDDERTESIGKIPNSQPPTPPRPRRLRCGYLYQRFLRHDDGRRCLRTGDCLILSVKFCKDAKFRAQFAMS